jgi:hypothetical protein
MQVPVGSNPTPSADFRVVAFLIEAGGNNHGHNFLDVAGVSVRSMGDASVFS